MWHWILQALVTDHMPQLGSTIGVFNSCAFFSCGVHSSIPQNTPDAFDLWLCLCLVFSKGKAQGM